MQSVAAGPSRSAKAVLCYVRPWNAEQFLSLARLAFPGASLTTCSEHKGCDHEGLRKLYHASLRRPVPSVVVGLDEDVAVDMIARCRLLRALSQAEARRHLYAMAQAVSDMIAARPLDVVLSLTTDSYIIDLLRHFSGRAGIPFIGLVPTFVNGFFRITARGEANASPHPDFDVVNLIRAKLLRTDYTPSFIANSVSNPKRGVLVRWAKNIIRPAYFSMVRLFSGDRYNYHYWVSQLIYNSFASIAPPSDPGSPDWASRVATDSRTPVYIPLQMFPECTVDYWCDDVAVVDYYAMLEKLIEKHHQTLLFVIKEHPSIMGQRPRGFYDKLRRDLRVVVVPTYTPSNAVLEKIPAVLVWTGTVGYEAALRGKAVLSLSRPFYASGQRYLHIGDTTSSEEMIGHIQACLQNPCTVDEQDQMLRYLVEQLCPGTFLNDGSWREENPDHAHAAEKMAVTVRAYYDALMAARQQGREATNSATIESLG